MTDPFNDLLASLGQLFGLTLHADKNNACALQIKKGLVIQLQPDERREKILLACRVVELPPGKFRENVLKETLKANAVIDPFVGVFAYVAKTNNLVLFQQYPIDILNGERLAGLILPFIVVAESWREAILAGNACPVALKTIPMGVIR